MEPKAPATELDNTPSAWAKDEVEWAVREGIMQGDQHGNLKLRDAVTREELCVMLSRLSRLG